MTLTNLLVAADMACIGRRFVGCRRAEKAGTSAG